jgi:valine--pyruvate aminotransferase
MKLTAFGEKFGGRSGIGELMDDLGQALRENPEIIFMCGGNPARIPQLEQRLEREL